MIVLDTTAVLAFMDRRDVSHDAVREWMRHFRVLRPSADGEAFTLLPADAP